MKKKETNNGKPSQLQTLDAKILAKQREIKRNGKKRTELKRHDPKKPIPKRLIVDGIINATPEQRILAKRYNINRQSIQLIDAEIENLRKRKSNLLAENKRLAPDIFVEIEP